MTTDFKHFWYIVAESHELTKNIVLSRQVCDEWLVCYRDSQGKATVMRDRCLHRCGKLSDGSVSQGILKCSYHGWLYGEAGKVVAIPSMGNTMTDNLKGRTYLTREQEGYIYVRLMDNGDDLQPFAMPYYQKSGWKNIRLQNDFQNTLSNCVENFIDIPHTAFVHKGIFRSSRNEAIRAEIKRMNGQVHVTYANEKQNLGSFNWFLNPRGRPIVHTDSYFMPNITFVSYSLESKWQYVITSQSVPVSAEHTKVYTEISFRFGLLTPFIGWLVKRQGQKVIDQDIQVLNQQMRVIKKYGSHFYDTPCDTIHTSVSEIINALYAKQDPTLLPDQRHEVTFRV
ncbi:MAG: aromatic ring-hydroxylating dioxygenase subunit alpha [Gammaproteobacteria bacterium]|nr:aromatic ring-hydroxylating dioxygenase subunit alpha [Gammaproteobacteria bacterium]